MKSMKELNSTSVSKPDLPIKILQFGAGNFLRGFADWMIDVMNTDFGYNHGVAIVQSIGNHTSQLLNEQDNLYHHIEQGVQNGKIVRHTRLIKCIQKVVHPKTQFREYIALANLESLELVISNTTEVGIEFKANDLPGEDELPITFPGKVTAFLYQRFKHFKGSANRGLVFLPTELIEENGKKLRDAINNYIDLWELPPAFKSWVNNHNHFANTLVDRIVPGYPEENETELIKQIGYYDKLMVTSELFHLWVIEGNSIIQEAFPAHKCNLNVVYTNDLTKYRTRKVQILNGAHTAMVAIGLLKNLQTVQECVVDEELNNFIRNVIANEIIPVLDSAEEELKTYAESVFERFKNPFIHHELKTISLNSIAKFKVRILPSILQYQQKFNRLPKGLLEIFAHLIVLYLSKDYKANDIKEVIDFFDQIKSGEYGRKDAINKILSNTNFWGQDLTEINGLSSMFNDHVAALEHS